MTLISALRERGATVRAYDPKAAEAAAQLLGEGVTLCGRSYDAVEGADALVVVTEWPRVPRARLRSGSAA